MAFRRITFAIGLTSLLFAIRLYASSPTDSLTHFVRSIHTYNQLFPREQVYLHFDNTGYFMGETIWFKAYVVSPQGFKPTALSRVLHVELLTPEGRVLQTQKLKIEDGQCHGHIPLAELLHAGFYEVRAYTAYMLNWKDAPVFSRVFPIFNAPKEQGVYDNPRMVKVPHTERLPEMRVERPKSEKLNVSFFPEGGSMVEGLPSTINFKATDKRGNPLEIEGRVLNNRGEVVGQMRTQHDGMGRFALQCHTGETYHAEVAVKGADDTQRFDLPAPLKQGYTMSVNNLRDGNMVVQLARNGLTDKAQDLGLTILCRGEVVVFKPIDWQGRNTALLNIPKGELPEGVNQLTLFDTQGRIHAERLTFISALSEKNISLVGEKDEELKPKQKVSLDFEVKDREGKPISTTFSLAVRDADTETPLNGAYGGGSMAANLLLGSELKGYIHDVDYYLEADDRTHRLHLDLLLCTQGWRRYDWTSMTRPHDFEVTYPVEEGIMVVGNLTSTFRNREKEGVEMKVYLFNESGDKRIGSAITDSVGKFAFLAEDFTGRWQMNIMTYEEEKLKEMNVNLQKVQSPQGRAYGSGETELFFRSSKEGKATTVQPDTLVEYDAEQKRRWENLLPTVKVEGQEEWQSEFIRKWNNIIYDMEDERMRMDETGEEYLEGFAEWLEKNNPYFTYEIIPANNSIIGKYKGKNVIFLINRLGTNGWFLSSNQDFSINLSDLTIQDVEAIAISDKLYVGMGLSQDISTNIEQTEDEAVITLFVRNDYFRYKDKRGHRKTKIQGFTPERKFYIPDYSYTNLPDEQDFRRTLYWNPNVTTDAEGKAAVQFYNTPTCRRIKISAETMTSEGIFLHK